MGGIPDPSETQPANGEKAGDPFAFDHEVVHGSLTLQVAQRLRELIIQDILRPGERIREKELANRLHISRTPLREAIKLLAAEGLISVAPNRGAVVADPAPEEIYELMEVLSGIEALAAELACQRALDAEIAEVRALHFEMLAAYERGDRLEYFRKNQAIHQTIVNAAHNEKLVEQHARLNGRVFRARFVSNLRNRRWENSITDHEKMLEALTRRDGIALSRILREHLGNYRFHVSEEGEETAVETSRGEK